MEANKMNKTWAYASLTSLISLGFTLFKRECDGYWVLALDGEMVESSRSQGDIIRKAAKEFGL
jgi:hypothetical protein